MAALAAILALLFNQALLSSAHLSGATASTGLAHHGVASAAEHGQAGFAAARADTGKERAAGHHQTCHFCRLLGIALPPPPTEQIGRMVVSVRLSWITAGDTIGPDARFRAGHPVRAPPPLA